MHYPPETNQKLLFAALMEGGTREIKGQKHNPKILEWFDIAGSPWINDDESAWCSAFMCGMAHKAGLHHPRTVRARRWLDLGPTKAKVIDDPEHLMIGDVVVFKRGAGGHVAILLHHMGNQLSVFGGNQRNAVQPKNYNLADFLGGRRLYALSEPELAERSEPRSRSA